MVELHEKKKAFNAVNFNRQKAKITNKQTKRRPSVTTSLYKQFFFQVFKQKINERVEREYRTLAILLT